MAYLGLTDDEILYIKDLCLMTLKPIMYIANVQDDGFEDEVGAVGVRVHTAEDFGEFLVIVWMVYLPRLAPFGEECFHTIQTSFVQRFKDVESGKDERA